MGKLIWNGWVNLDERISSQAAFITGANLRKQPQKPVEKQEKEAKKEPKKPINERRLIDG